MTNETIRSIRLRLYSAVCFFLILCALSACGPLQETINPYEENFKCRAKDDEGKCVDTPTAYKEARYPEITEDTQNPPNDHKHKVQDSRYKILIGLLQEVEKPILQPPKILRVLLLPYKGEEGELFMTRYVYVKIEDSQWILTDLSEQ
jgi:conjugal transfer pilus assembly protein TraV